MVNTRSMTRKERENEKETKLQLQTIPPPLDGQSQREVQAPTASQAAGSSVKSEYRLLSVPVSRGGAKSSSTTSSLQARRKQLELEMAKEKARIQLDLINKKYEADLAKLRDEEEKLYSPSCDPHDKTQDVEKWLEQSNPEAEPELRAPDYGKQPGAQCPPAAADPGPSSGTVHMLASALQNLTAGTVNTGANNNLLSRICTPRDLPNYSGDPLEWLQFKQAYSESTEVCGFTPKENLWRLRKCLHGPAREAVSALMISASSPDTVVKTLELLYGNPDIILNKIIQSLKKLQPMANEYNKDIVSFSVKVQNFIAAVHAVGRHEYIQGMSIVNIILSKLPTVLISKWSDYSFTKIQDGNKSRLQILGDFLSEEAVKISTTANIHFTEPRSGGIQLHSHTKGKSDNNTGRPYAVLLQTTRSENKCLFCRVTTHSLTECKQFKRALRKDRWRHIRRHGLCYKCLVSRHNRNDCQAPVCDKDGCGEPHHRLLHYVNNPDLNGETTKEAHNAPQSADSSTTTETVAHVNSDNRKVLLKVVPVRVHGPNGVISSTALLDDGSSVSLISADLARRAGLRGRPEEMRVRGAFNGNDLVCAATVMSVDLSGMDSKVHNIRMRCVNELSLPLQSLSILNCISYPCWTDIKPYLCTDDVKPQSLIGQDNQHLLSPLEIRLGNLNEPSATLTALGWCAHGNVSVPQGSRPPYRRPPIDVHTNLFISDNIQGGDGTTNEILLSEIHEDVRRSFSIDCMGVSGPPRQNADDARAVAQLERSAALVAGRWHVGLPWRDERAQMPDAYPSALHRIKTIENKMAKNKGFSDRYRERVNHLLENDYAAELTSESDSSRTWYLPHFGVDNPNKEKLRLVFDAASKVQGKSLNDYLLTGPDLLSSLLGIMLRFREHKIAVTGDIKDMFLRIKIHADDQHALRFLWRDNPKEKMKTYVMTSLIFGASCSPFVAQFIKNINARRYESALPAAVDAIYNSHYMDDYIHSLPDEDTAIQMVKNVSDIHKSGGFEIRNWTSNSMSVLESVPRETLGKAAVRFKVGQQNESERTLGLIWFPADDTLGFDVSLKRIPESIINGEERPTKRLMLKVIMSIFDVLGFLAPFTIQGRIMLQDTWRLNIAWDDQIPDDIYNKWRKWIDLLKVINKIRIPRCYKTAEPGRDSDSNTRPGGVSEKQEAAYAEQVPTASPAPLSPLPAGPQPAATQRATGGYEPVALSTSATPNYNDLQLHIFSDASLKAMCTVAYWRWINNGFVAVAFIASKCRVMPVKPLTVPRAELQAALLAARLADTIKKEHKLTPVRRYFWCDSTTVLHWIRNNTRTYKTFEANRLGEIDELTRANEWRYVPTKLNVADLATREQFFQSLQEEWLTGPIFLFSDETSWPRDVILPESNVGSECVAIVQGDEIPVRLPVPDPTRFSSWLRLTRATAAVLKFIALCKGHAGRIDCDKMERAERLLLRYAQAESFADELSCLTMGKAIPRSSRLINLTPILDAHGLLRAGGRIDAATDVPPETRRPVILDGRHPVARLIIRHHHVKTAHGYQETVVNELRQRYWILRLRPAVKFVSSRCMLCRIRKSKPQVPRMGDLPRARMAHHQRPFSHCGLDLFGPMEVTIGRRREKRYGVLFTCLTVRAVHIELVASLTSDSLIMALRRMAARRGWPRYLYSDNGTNLRGADSELQRSIQELDTEALKTEGVNNGLEWNFIPPASPHWGGAWERLIRSIKTTLKVILNERAPREEVLNTLMLEVESMVNGRPLTHVSVEPGDVESLTPNHFLLGTSSNLPVIGAFDDSDLYLRKQWRIAQRLADMCWQRWVKEILPDLIPRTKWQGEQKALKVGDLVLVVDPNSPRNTWPKGVVVQVFPGRDGRVRMVEVRTATGTWRRSAARVAPIPMVDECCDQH